MFTWSCLNGTIDRTHATGGSMNSDSRGPGIESRGFHTSVVAGGQPDRPRLTAIGLRVADDALDAPVMPDAVESAPAVLGHPQANFGQSGPVELSPYDDTGVEAARFDART